MDEQLVLTAQTLRLNPDLQRADAPGDVFVVKNVPGRKYLTVSLEQWSLLLNFANPATVPDVLRAVILNRTCLPLREYYELILKAYHAGVLQPQRHADVDVRACRWFISLNPWIPIVLALASAASVGVCLAEKPFPLPGIWPQPALIQMLIGWGLLAAGLSLGQALAGSVLRWGGGEIYDPTLRLLRPVPYFAVSLEDAPMTSRVTQVGIWCARLFPVVGTTAVLWWYRPEWALLHVLGLIVMLRPFASGSVPQLISTACRGLVLDTQKDLLFSLNRRWNVMLKFGLARISAAYLFGRLLWGIIWVIFFLFIGLRAAGQNMSDVFGSRAYWTEVGGVFGVAGLAAVLAYVAVPVVRGSWVYLRARMRQTSKTWRRWRARSAAPATPDQVNRILAESLLFRRVSPAERSELCAGGKLEVFKSWRTIHRFGDKSTQVGVIISGKLSVYRRLKSGRAEKALELSEGDVFGAHALLDPERQQVQIRTLTPVIALMIPMAEFEARLLQPLGPALINDLVQKVPFLRTVSFCASWHPQAVARFAQLSSMSSYHEGEVIVAERQDTQQFYVVYEGRVLVKRKNRVRGRLRAGAYFGEVSILQNSAAISDVVAKEQTRCLLISKADFLRFVTHNPLVSLQLEEISSHRLGRPVFPLIGHSFEVR